MLFCPALNLVLLLPSHFPLEALFSSRKLGYLFHLFQENSLYSCSQKNCLSLYTVSFNVALSKQSCLFFVLGLVSSCILVSTTCFLVFCLQTPTTILEAHTTELYPSSIFLLLFSFCLLIKALLFKNIDY